MWPTIGYGTYRFRRILVVQTQRMGDVLCATPLFTALRRQFPKSQLGALVQSASVPVLAGNPDLDEVVPYDLSLMRRSLLHRIRFIGELRERDFDLCLSIHAASSVAFALWQAAIPWRICVWRYGREKKPPWVWTFHQHVRQERQRGTEHEIEHNLNVLRELGMDAEPSSYRVCISPAEQEWARGFLQHLGLLMGRPLAVIHPGHGGGRQEWPPEYYAAVGSGLVRRGWQVAVSGSGREGELVERVCSGIEGEAVSLAGKLDLRQFAAALTHARLFVSVPTGPMHLAAACGVPVVPLYGPADLAIDLTRFAPHGVPSVPISSPVRCPCPSSRVCSDPVCMRELRPELVLEGIDRLQRRPAPAGVS